MKEVTIRNQKEWDELDKNFSVGTKVIFRDAKIAKLDKNYKNCVISMYGSSTVDSMYDSSRVGSMSGSSRVNSMYNTSTVDSMSGTSTVDSMYDSSRVGSMYNTSTVDSMSGSSRVNSMSDSSTVNSMYDTSRVNSMYGSSTVDYMSGSSTVDSMYDSSRVGSMYNTSTVDSMSGSSRVNSMSGSSRVNSMSGSSRVNSMYNTSTVDSMSGTSSVGSMYGTSRVNKAFDGSVIFTNNPSSVVFADSGVTIKRMDILSSFETMLEHGILRADGITKAFKQVKEIGDGIKVYYLEDDTFCAQSEMTFAHAKTLKMAVIDLKFKLSDRDTSDYEDLSLDDKLSFDDAVICYRDITGACSGGVEDFLDKNKVEDKGLTIGRIIELTKGAYQGDAFARFFGGMEER